MEYRDNKEEKRTSTMVTHVENTEITKKRK